MMIIKNAAFRRACREECNRECSRAVFLKFIFQYRRETILQKRCEKAEMSLDEFEKAMSKAGYKIPELV